MSSGVPGGDPTPAPPARSGRARSLAFAALGAVLSAIGIWWVFRSVDPGELVGSAHRIRVLPLLASFAVYWLVLVPLRAVLVRRLLAPVGSLGLGRAYRCICIGFLGNNVLPLRAGDVVRSAAISRGARLGFASVVGGLAVERMLDLFFVALLALGAIRVAPGLPDAVRTGALGSAVALGVGFVALAILARRRRERDEAPVAEGGAAGSLGRRLRELWHRFSAGFASFGTARGAAAAVGLSAAIWALALLTIVLRLWTFDLEPDPAVALVLLAALGFGVAVPSAPGYVGTYHAAAAFALALFGVDHQLAAAFGLFSWIIDIGCSSLAGAISLSVEGMTLGELRRRRAGSADSLPRE